MKRNEVVLVFSPGRVIGGAEIYLSRLASALVGRAGLRLCCPDSAELDSWVAEIELSGATVVRYPLAGTWRRFQFALQFLITCRRSSHLIINQVTPMAGTGAAFAGWVTRVPRRVGVQHLVLCVRDMTRYWIKRPYVRWKGSLASRLLTKLITPSQASADLLTGEFNIPVNHIKVIRHGVESVPLIDYTEPRPRPRPTGGQEWPILGCVGWVSERKGQRFLLEAVALLAGEYPGIRAVLVGGSEDSASFAQIAARLGVSDRVTFTGHLDDPSYLYRTMDMFVLVSRAEGLPLSVIEAMSWGLPIVAFDIPPLRETVGDTGLLFSSRTGDATAAAVRTLLRRRDAADLGNASRQRARAMFSAEAMRAETMATIFEES